MSYIVSYLLKTLAYAAAGGAAAALLRRRYLRKRGRRTRLRRELLFCLFVAYCVGLASQTVLPEWQAGLLADGRPFLDVALGRGARGINLVPFRTIRAQLRLDLPGLGAGDRVSNAVLNLVGNVLIFVPLGLLPPLLWPRLNRFLPAAGCGLLLCVGIEAVQVFIARSPDVDDVILNLAGILLGFGLQRLLRRLLALRRKT